MFLKSIDVQGFKSFANRIKFEFNNGITAIVGPNGSGKSNVADAVRWVLGEQRIKQLRGGNMQDVIFSGTENRKPMSYASVSITLDNSDHALAIDFEEVTVTRRLYRSGESEYLINGSVCRLRDVNELFYDTGIGKEGYSIIGQGQIDRILSEKPDDRRELFDEAAGIVKFKRRKAMTQKKLEDEHSNLLRVTDILSEIEKQLGPLKVQSENAKIYLQRKEELKSYDINMFLLETERIRNILNDISGKLRIVEDELTDSNQAFARTKEEYQKVEDELDTVDAELADARDQLGKTTMLKQQLEGQIEVLKEQINTVRANEDHFGRRIEVIQSEITLREEKLNGFSEEKAALQEEIKEVQVKLAESISFLTDSANLIGKIENDIEETKSTIINTLNDRANTRAKLQRYDTISEQNSIRKSELNQKVLSLKNDDDAISGELIKLQLQINEIYDNADNVKADADRTDERIKVLGDELKQDQAKQESLNESYHKENSRLEALINMTERYEGYGNSVKRVMEKKDRVRGIIGVVADIIRTGKQYELAIETALGGAISNIVVDSEETAKRMIGFLKDNRFGRATFLPLDAVSGNNHLKEEEALEEKGVIGLASELVDVDPEYSDIANELLGRIIVVDNVDNAVLIGRKYHHSLRMVTIEGELLAPGGSMTGGAFKNAGNLLGRRREIEELDNKVKSLKEELDKITEAIELKKQEKGECYRHLDEINETLRELKISLNTLQVNQNNLNERKDAISSELEEFEKERLEIESRSREIKNLKDKVGEELTASEAFEKDSNFKIEVLTKELDQVRLENEGLRLDSEEIRLKNAELEQKISFVSENESRISEEIRKFREETQEIEQARTGSSDLIRDKEDRISELGKTIIDSSELFEEINNTISEKTAKREELNTKYKSFIDSREKLSGHIGELDKEKFRLTSQKEGYDKALEDQITYMWDEYEMTLNRAMELKDENLTNLPFIKKQIAAIRSEMKAMGPVNINAIEDYRDNLERFNFLDGQRNDLVNAENALLEIIKELDQGMRKQFDEQFALIRDEFNKVFKKLFGGGVATLELVEDEDILEAGIRIIAQPPGKKLQNMLQMSGGEKALTAIALLFAIQNLKPSPFCLLDEIEAALDDANVKRFAEYLNHLTEHTQFIMITHRRGTMAVADRLYGITMQEKGVSTLVSVDLLEDKLDA